LIVLGLLVFVHEAGHFLSARKFGIFCDEFGFGFPPRIVGFQRIKKGQLQKIVGEKEVGENTDQAVTDEGEPIKEHTVVAVAAEIDKLNIKPGWRIIWGSRELTDEDKKFNTVYSLNWIPLGGFVKIKGEQGNDKDQQDSFGSRPAWKRAVVLAAGVLMNIVLAYVLLTGSMISGMPQQVENGQGMPFTDHRIQILEVSAGSTAEKSKILLGDVIQNIDGKTFSNTGELQDYVADKSGKELTYNILRGKDKLVIKITPTVLAATGKGGIGITIADVGTVKYPWYKALVEGFKATFILLWAILVGLYGLLHSILKGVSIGAQVAGPVGIATMTGQMANMGWVYLVQFTAMLSLNLAVINILPIPALDGGRLLFLLIEKLRGKPMNEKLEASLNNVFFLLLLLLVVFITYKDVVNLGCLTCKLGSFFK